jgi:hypothetical protein
MGCAPCGIIACTARLAAGADRWEFEDTLQQAEALPARLGRRPLQRHESWSKDRPYNNQSRLRKLQIFFASERAASEDGPHITITTHEIQVTNHEI